MVKLFKRSRLLAIWYIQSTNSDDLVEWFPATKSDILFLSLKATGALDALSVIQMDPESAEVKTYFTGDGSEGIKNTSAAVSRGGTDFKLPVAPTEAVKLAREAADPAQMDSSFTRWRARWLCVD